MAFRKDGRLKEIVFKSNIVLFFCLSSRQTKSPVHMLLSCPDTATGKNICQQHNAVPEVALQIEENKTYVCVTVSYVAASELKSAIFIFFLLRSCKGIKVEFRTYSEVFIVLFRLEYLRQH